MKNIISISFTVLFLSSTLIAQTELIPDKEKLINYSSRYSAGFLGGDAFSSSFLIHQGISITRHFETTLAIGLEKYYYYRYMPFLLDFQYNILKKNTTPYLRIASGYLLDLERNGLGVKENFGITIGGVIGVKTRISNKLTLFTELGYRYSKLERTQYYYWGGIWPDPSPIIETHTNRLELRIGIGIN